MLLTGDLNGRARIEPDVMDTQGNNHVSGQAPLFTTQGNNHVSGQVPLFTTPSITCQNNTDSEVNQSGREMVHLCWALGL